MITRNEDARGHASFSISSLKEALRKESWKSLYFIFDTIDYIVNHTNFEIQLSSPFVQIKQYPLIMDHMYKGRVGIWLPYLKDKNSKWPIILVPGISMLFSNQPPFEIEDMGIEIRPTEMSQPCYQIFITCKFKCDTAPAVIYKLGEDCYTNVVCYQIPVFKEGDVYLLKLGSICPIVSEQTCYFRSKSKGMVRFSDKLDDLVPIGGYDDANVPKGVVDHTAEVLEREYIREQTSFSPKLLELVPDFQPQLLDQFTKAARRKTQNTAALLPDGMIEPKVSSEPFLLHQLTRGKKAIDLSSNLYKLFLELCNMLPINVMQSLFEWYNKKNLLSPNYERMFVRKFSEFVQKLRELHCNFSLISVVPAEVEDGTKGKNSLQMQLKGGKKSGVTGGSVSLKPTIIRPTNGNRLNPNKRKGISLSKHPSGENGSATKPTTAKSFIGNNAANLRKKTGVSLLNPLKPLKETSAEMILEDVCTELNEDQFASKINLRLSNGSVIVIDDPEPLHLVFEDVPGDNDCGYRALDPNRNRAINSERATRSALIEDLRNNLDNTLRGLIAPEIVGRIILGEFVISETSSDLRNVANAISRSIIAGNFQQAIEAAANEEIAKQYLDFLLNNANNVQGWLQFNGIATTGIADAIAHRQGMNLVLVEGRPRHIRGMILHKYGNNGSPFAQTIYVVQVTDVHYGRATLRK